MVCKGTTRMATKRETYFKDVHSYTSQVIVALNPSGRGKKLFAYLIEDEDDLDTMYGGGNKPGWRLTGDAEEALQNNWYGQDSQDQIKKDISFLKKKFPKKKFIVTTYTKQTVQLIEG